MASAGGQLPEPAARGSPRDLVIGIDASEINRLPFFDRDQVQRPVEHGFMAETARESRQLYALATCFSDLEVRAAVSDQPTSVWTSWARTELRALRPHHSGDHGR